MNSHDDEPRPAIRLAVLPGDRLTAELILPRARIGGEERLKLLAGLRPPAATEEVLGSDVVVSALRLAEHLLRLGELL